MDIQQRWHGRCTDRDANPVGRRDEPNRKFPDDVLADTNIYVALQVTDDLDYVARNVNTDYLVCGTDYGHYDTSTEIEALRKVRDDGKLADGVVDKILDDNARKLYALN